MTRRSIEEQVEILRSATEKAGVSPEAASAFLRSAGISVGRDIARRQHHAYSLADGGQRATRSVATGKETGSKRKK